jgi:hypothetical protein
MHNSLSMQQQLASSSENSRLTSDNHERVLARSQGGERSADSEDYTSSKKVKNTDIGEAAGLHSVTSTDRTDRIPAMHGHK